MSQAMNIYYHLKEMEEEASPATPKAVHILYSALLKEKYKVKKFRKKPFKEHYIITLEDSFFPGGMHFHLTPDEMWWEC